MHLPTVQYFRQTIKSNKIRLAPPIIVGLIASLIGLIVPWFYKFFIDEILVNQNINYLIPCLITWSFFEITRSAGFGLRSVYDANAVESVNQGAGLLIINKIHNCAKNIFNKYPTGTFISHIREIEDNSATIVDLICELTEISAYIIALPFVFYLISPVLSLIVLITIVLCLVSSKILSTQIDSLHSKRRKTTANYTENILLSIEHAFPIRSYGITADINAELENQAHSVKLLNIKKSVSTQIGKVINRSILSVGSLFYRLVTVYLVYDGKMTIGDFFAYDAILALVFSPIEVLTALIKPTQEMITNDRRINALLTYPNQSSGNKLLPTSGNLNLENVSYKYDDASHPIISNFNYSYKSGVVYGLSGMNGSGKSTLLQLLARYFDPKSGMITFDSIPLNDFNRDDYHSSSAYILSSGYIFPASFQKNILLNKVFDRVRLDSIVQDFDIADLATHFPANKNSYLGNNPINLSSGETQKINLARVIYHNYKILLFDEAFSHFDELFKVRIISIIKKYLSNSIIIIASHDLSTLKHTDTILHIDRGVLIESGSPMELLAYNSKFSGLFQSDIAHPKC